VEQGVGASIANDGFAPPGRPGARPGDGADAVHPSRAVDPVVAGRPGRVQAGAATLIAAHDDGRDRHDFRRAGSSCVDIAGRQTIVIARQPPAQVSATKFAAPPVDRISSLDDRTSTYHQ
jgi:hypothetical protein